MGFGRLPARRRADHSKRSSALLACLALGRADHRRRWSALQLRGTIRLRMSIPAEKRDLRLMRAMFSTIAPRYDFITRIFSYGMDRRWKRRCVEMASLPERAIV